MNGNGEKLVREESGKEADASQLVKLETQSEKIARIKRELSQVPTLPGVYMWKSRTGEVLYVGKAKQLRARMRQYVNLSDERAKIPLLVEQIDSFEYIVTENEHESLVLEKNLINEHAPFYNADFKDDKSYPFIAVTKGDTFPAIKYTREKHKSGTRYFGPYTDARAARRLIDIARRVVPLCSASCPDWRRLNRRLQKIESEHSKNSKRAQQRAEMREEAYEYFLEEAVDLRPCFDCTVGLGPGPCCGKITPDEYAENVHQIERFLAGQRDEVLARLREEMDEAAEELDFERASRTKQRIETIESLAEKQHVTSTHALDADVFGFHRDDSIAAVQALMVREGRVVNSNDFILDKGSEIPDEDLIHNFLLRYYDTTTSIPREVVMRKRPEDAEVMSGWLTEKLASAHGAKVRFSSPERGDRASLLDMAETNARHALLRYKVRTNYDDKRVNSALLQLESALALDSAPMRIESFDISTIHGSYTVASMVVFTGGKPDKNQYRRFKIRNQLDEANDFLSMQEVIRRRYSPERMADERFGERPDLIILDGGKPQLTAAMEVLEELGVGDIPVAGLAKRDEELFVPWQESGPVVLPGGSASLYLVKQVRDEAHRFAITFHRELRGKGMTSSVLDDVAGLGPVRKKALLKAFGGWRKLCEASLEEIKESKAIPNDVADELWLVMEQYRAAYNERQSDS